MSGAAEIIDGVTNTAQSSSNDNEISVAQDMEPVGVLPTLTNNSPGDTHSPLTNTLTE